MNRKVKIKDVKELGHLSNYLNLEVVDGNIKSVTIDVCGESITITKDNDYSSYISILVNETKVEETTYSVVGKIGGMEIYPMEFGTDKYKAEQFIQDKSEYNFTELYIEENTVFVNKTKVN